MKKNIGEIFQEETKYFRNKPSTGSFFQLVRPEQYKEYPGVPVVKLDDPDQKGGMPLWEAISRRRSIRDFKDKPINKKLVSQLLWASQGITATVMGFELRAVPSAGALYPVETYLAIRNVEGIEAGIYHYGVRGHELHQLRLGDFSSTIAHASLDQDFLAQANLVFIWTAVFLRSKWKYGQRAYRYVYLDVGHIAENVALASVSLGLGSCQVAAHFDNEVNSIIGVDGSKESVLYLTAVGYPA